MYESALLDWDHRTHTGPASYDPRGVLRAHNTHFQRIGHTAAFRPGIAVQPCATVRKTICRYRQRRVTLGMCMSCFHRMAVTATTPCMFYPYLAPHGGGAPGVVVPGSLQTLTGSTATIAFSPLALSSHHRGHPCLCAPLFYFFALFSVFHVDFFMSSLAR